MPLPALHQVHTGFIDAFKFFMYVSIVAHLLACFFFLWPTLSTCEVSTRPPPQQNPRTVCECALAFSKVLLLVDWSSFSCVVFQEDVAFELKRWHAGR